MRFTWIHQRLDRFEWWWFRRELWWAYVRDSGRMLNRRVNVENVLFGVYRGKRGPLTRQECHDLAMYLGSRERPLLVKAEDGGQP